MISSNATGSPQAAVQILLASCNSGKYLPMQLDSILAQDFPDFELLIRDAASTDDTPAVIHSYQQKHPDRIRFLGSGKASAAENFSLLLRESSSPLVMFSDHDDVWFPDKISVTLAKYREMESAYGADAPMMVFTDSCVVDSDLNPIAPSMLGYQHLDAEHLTLNRLLVQNVASGNTMLVNRALLDLACPIPPEAVMHDHWLALAAAQFGKIGIVGQPTLFYRQHTNNVYGAFSYSLPAMLRKFKDGKTKIRARFLQNLRQGEAFGKRFEAALSARDREMLSVLAHWEEYGFCQKRRLILKYHLRKSGFLRNLGMFAVL